MKSRKNLLAIAASSALAGGLLVSTAASASELLNSAAELNARVTMDTVMGEGKCGEGKCGGESGEGKCGEGKCGEGKCGGESGEGKCGEGKCGGSQ